MSPILSPIGTLVDDDDPFLPPTKPFGEVVTMYDEQPSAENSARPSIINDHRKYEATKARLRNISEVQPPIIEEDDHYNNIEDDTSVDNNMNGSSYQITTSFPDCSTNNKYTTNNGSNLVQSRSHSKIGYRATDTLSVTPKDTKQFFPMSAKERMTSISHSDYLSPRDDFLPQPESEASHSLLPLIALHSDHDEIIPSTDDPYTTPNVAITGESALDDDGNEKLPLFSIVHTNLKKNDVQSESEIDTIDEHLTLSYSNTRNTCV